jgi:hypothetical protein
MSRPEGKACLITAARCASRPLERMFFAITLSPGCMVQGRHDCPRPAGQCNMRLPVGAPWCAAAAAAAAADAVPARVLRQPEMCTMCRRMRRRCALLQVGRRGVLPTATRRSSTASSTPLRPLCSSWTRSCGTARIYFRARLIAGAPKARVPGALTLPTVVIWR